MKLASFFVDWEFEMKADDYTTSYMLKNENTCTSTTSLIN